MQTIKNVQIDPLAIVQEVDITDDDLKFKTPFAMSISGASMSGKSQFIVRLIENRHLLFDAEIKRIIYCVPETLALRPNPIFEQIKATFPTAELNLGLPDIVKLNLTLAANSGVLLCIDDLMKSFFENEDMLTLLTAGVHHLALNLIFVIQDHYLNAKHRLTFMKNCSYRVIFFNRLDLTEIRTISTQICQQPKFLLDSFEFLKKEYPDEPAYIVFDGCGKSPLKNLFVRSQIFPVGGQTRPVFFLPKNVLK